MRMRSSSLTIVVNKLQESNMIRRTAKYLVMAGIISFAAYGHAGTSVVTPALAACSKALIESISKAETLPAYTVKAPSPFLSEMVDPNAFTVLAHNVRTKELLAKASCKATPAGQILSFKSIPLKS
jgi:hypothetical protein